MVNAVEARIASSQRLGGNASGNNDSGELVVLFLRPSTEGGYVLEQLAEDNPLIAEAGVFINKSAMPMPIYSWNRVGGSHDCSRRVGDLRDAGEGPAVVGVLLRNQSNFDELAAVAKEAVDRGAYWVVRRDQD